MLTLIVENSNFEKKYIATKLKYPPEILNNKYDIGPANIDDISILTLRTIKVSLKPRVSRAISVTILLRPSFAPGKIAISGFGIYVSIIYKIKLYPTRRLRKVNFLVLIFLVCI
jgi:hypothetical protein